MAKILLITVFLACAHFVASAAEPLTNEGILKLAKARVGEQIILSMIETQPGDYKTDPDSVIELKSGGVSEKVINAIIHAAVAGRQGRGAAAGSGGATASATIMPRIISKVEPIYTDQASKAKITGSVMLSLVVNTNGEAEDIKVIKSLGMGLDEQAIEAVKTWRWEPGTNKGGPVRVRAQVEVNFRSVPSHSR